MRKRTYFQKSLKKGNIKRVPTKKNLRVLFLTFSMVNFIHVLGTVVREVSIQGKGDGTAVDNQVLNIFG